MNSSVVLVWVTALFFAPVTAVPSIGDRVVAGYFGQEHLPLTVGEATDANWTAVTGDSTACDPVSGRRFRFRERLTPTLFFDNTDHLAGLQMVVDDTIFLPYPQTNVRSPPFFPANGDRLATSTLAVHFKDPVKLCSAEAADHVAGSIGDRLWVRLGTASAQAADFEQIPLLEKELQAGMPSTGWSKGSCMAGFPGTAYTGMGTHYFRMGSGDNACVDFGPLFLLYDRATLAGFGLLLFGTKGHVPTVGGKLPSLSASSGAYVADGELFEFPGSVGQPLFFAPQPTPACVANYPGMWDQTSAGASNLTIFASMHFALSDTSAMSCELLARVIACATDEECPAGFGCSSASMMARMLLFSSMPPTRGQCVPL